MIEKKKEKEGEIVKQNQLKPNKKITIKRIWIKFNKLFKIKKNHNKKGIIFEEPINEWVVLKYLRGWRKNLSGRKKRRGKRNGLPPLYILKHTPLYLV